MGSTKIGFIWLYRKLHHYVFTTSFCIDKLAHKQITDRFYSSKPLHQYLFSLAGVCTKGFYTYQHIFATNKLLHQQFLHRECFISYQHFLHRQVFTPQVFTPTCFYTSELYQIVTPTNSNILIYTILHRLPFRRQTSRPCFTNKLRRQRVLTENVQRFLHWHCFSQTCFNEAFLIDVV